MPMPMLLVNTRSIAQQWRKSTTTYIVLVVLLCLFVWMKGEASRRHITASPPSTSRWEKLRTADKNLETASEVGKHPQKKSHVFLAGVDLFSCHHYIVLTTAAAWISLLRQRGDTPAQQLQRRPPPHSLKPYITSMTFWGYGCQWN